MVKMMLACLMMFNEKINMIKYARGDYVMLMHVCFMLATKKTQLDYLGEILFEKKS
jgi:hypothetical protein